jgi:signal peptidase II
VTGKVVDFLDFFIGSHHWPAFNLADVAITAGAFLLAYAFLRDSKATSDGIDPPDAS